MTDRFNPYSMQQGNFNPAMLQQQQLSQQSQQQQQGDQHPLAMQGISNPERARMWQMMQQQMQQRPQGLGGDSSSSQVAPQMAELLRSQQLARLHGGQQQQQQFGLPMNQHPNFPDQTNGQATQMPANFGNMNSPTAPHSQQRSALINAFNSSQGLMSRQLDMMGLAQNQQNQNPQLGPSGVAGRPNQPQNGMPGQNQPQPMLFSSPMAQHTEPHRGSPHPAAQTPASAANMQSFMQSNSSGTPDGRRAMTLVELKERATSLQQFIREREAFAMNLTQNKATMDHATFTAQMQNLAAEVQTKRDLLIKVVDAIKRMAPGFMNGSGNGQQNVNNGNMQPMGSPAPPNRQPVPSGQNQAPWMQQPPNQAAGFPMRNGPQLPARGPSQPQTSPQMPQMGQTNPEQQRPGSTPHQLMPGQVPSQMSPALSNQFAGNRSNGQNMGQLTLPPPLEKGKFDESFAAFCSSRPTPRDERLRLIDNRPVDLHKLHFHVMREGGAPKVTQRDLWPVIGARLGYTQFPSSGAEPARSGSGVSQQLQHLYAAYLEQFDKIYVHSVFQKQAFSQQNQGVPPSNPSGQSNGAAPGNNVTPSPSGSVPGANQVQMMNAVMRYANMSAAEMRNGNPPLPDQVIAFVEANRSHLQRSLQQQEMLRGIVSKPNQPPQGFNPERPNTQYPGLQNQPVQPPTMPNVPTGGSQPQPPTTNQAGQGPAPPTQGSNQGPPGMTFPLRPRPTLDQGRQAGEWVQRAKSEFLAQSLPTMKTYPVPEEQRAKFIEMMHHIHRLSAEFEGKLPMFFYVVQDANFVRRIIAIVLTIQEQIKIFRSGGQKFILAPQNIPILMNQLTAVNQQFHVAVASWMNQQANNNAATNGQSGPNGPQPLATVPNPPQQSQHTPVQSTPNLPPQNIPPTPSNRSINLNQPPLPTSKKKPSQTQINQVVNVGASTPTPPASTPTPAANAATPATPITAPSPKTPKSPKGKNATKQKVPPQPKRKLSKAVAPTPEAVQPTAPSPSSSLKRQREEETPAASGSSGVSNAPSPKKAKTEWDSTPSEALAKKEEQIDNIKSDEDASVFLEQMTELIRLHASNDGQGDSLTSDISETLDMILKGCGQDPSDSSGASSMAPLGLGDASQPSNPLPAADEFQDFLDFTSCAAEDPLDPSKPATPDLISSSSTNPSPESATDAADAAGLSAASDNARLANLKSDSDLYDPDPLRLGVWREIDGGESAYYQSDKWNWEGPMQALEQPWAFAS